MRCCRRGLWLRRRAPAGQRAAWAAPTCSGEASCRRRVTAAGLVRPRRRPTTSARLHRGKAASSEQQTLRLPGRRRTHSCLQRRHQAGQSPRLVGAGQTLRRRQSSPCTARGCCRRAIHPLPALPCPVMASTALPRCSRHSCWCRHHGARASPFPPFNRSPSRLRRPGRHSAQTCRRRRPSWPGAPACACSCSPATPPAGACCHGQMCPHARRTKAAAAAVPAGWRPSAGASWRGRRCGRRWRSGGLPTRLTLKRRCGSSRSCSARWGGWRAQGSVWQLL